MKRRLMRCFAFLLLGCMLIGVASAQADKKPETVVSRDCPAGSQAVQQLAKIENTRDLNYNCLSVSLDDRANILALRFEKHEFGSNRGSTRIPLPPQVREFTPAEIAAGQGVVLDGTPGHDAIKLRGRIVAGAPAASLVVSYLHNGLVGEFRECGVSLERNGPNWLLLNAESRRVPLVVVRTWALPLVGTVGIDTLQGICPSA
jgi:hypothetical protein